MSSSSCDSLQFGAQGFTHSHTKIGFSLCKMTGETENAVSQEWNDEFFVNEERNDRYAYRVRVGPGLGQEYIFQGGHHMCGYQSNRICDVRLLVDWLRNGIQVDVQVHCSEITLPPIRPDFILEREFIGGLVRDWCAHNPNYVGAPSRSGNFKPGQNQSGQKRSKAGFFSHQVPSL